MTAKEGNYGNAGPSMGTTGHPHFSGSRGGDNIDSGEKREADRGIQSRREGAFWPLSSGIQANRRSQPNRTARGLTVLC
jgi:hypothetical protein